MSTNSMRKPKRVLEPVERISEFLFGFIMVLTLTCTFNASGASRGSVHTLLIEALGCNVAWGMIDAFFYLVNSLGQRGHGGARLEPHEIESLREKLTQIPESTVWPRLAEEDWLGALGVFLLVFLSLFPVVVPFIFVSNV